MDNKKTKGHQTLDKINASASKIRKDNPGITTTTSVKAAAEKYRHEKKTPKTPTSPQAQTSWLPTRRL